MASWCSWRVAILGVSPRRESGARSARRRMLWMRACAYCAPGRAAALSAHSRRTLIRVVFPPHAVTHGEKPHLGPLPRSRQMRSLTARTQNAMNEAGVCSASVGTRESAGWMRCWSASKSKPRSVAIMISPSITHRSGSSAVAAATSSGKYRVIGRSLRLPSSTCSRSLSVSRFGVFPTVTHGDWRALRV
jgi:hypothetical protein